MSANTNLPLTLAQLVERALDQGVTQVEAAGSPLHPLLLDDTGKLMILFNERGEDPMELACQVIKAQAPEAIRCALAIDSRITLADGKKWDAIVVMACQRGSEQGEVWAQRYVPKGLFRKFRVEGVPERVGAAKDFISAALSET
ncbi:hypothetical protein FN976_06830 [Caenimonas sedimenti]|uniref:Uncharacterized protein n=1 Tax=Caenimonas sedimenti TaxID=2596921 RepID=A0A562ZUZ3_9BURK|nr:hypothetical protein [Caenimonas sedimenti]TWO72410.1 hypothetical protein FN976_06830 [Caenimonas sedimenti]